MKVNMMQLLEIALVDELDKAPDTLPPCSVDSLVDLLPSLTSGSCGNEFDNHTKCGPQGVNCSRSEILLDYLVMSLASECIQYDRQTSGFGGPTFQQDLNKFVFLSQAGQLLTWGAVNMIFPSSEQWMDDLMHLIFFLHLEGVKLRPKVERSYSSCAKATCSSELENVVFHEDKAHFGDLFCESGRGLQKDMISHQLLLTLAPARSEEAKASHEKLIFSAHRTIGGPTSGSNTTRLSYWTRNIDRLCLSWDDIGSTMSSILGFWKAKHAAVVEDLGIERDIFILCWDFPTIGTAKGPSASFRDQSRDS
ncbi:hypothetical protein Prudu_010193 [Prunus dulcis]|uniref:Uncharacterized protein n=1 Tax=Prunus dulcis TaxID=3755 RepID=A0A4Y1R800_PRUDU|nr:hypothetical protein Prudu_010193 [Prunus dulcis]